jgi:hypothetical protein
VVAADARMLSAWNLTAVDEAGLEFIVGSRSVKAPIDLASYFHWHGDVFTDGLFIDTVTPRHASSAVNDIAHRAEPVWKPDDPQGAWRAIWAYSTKRARRGAGWAAPIDSQHCRWQHLDPRFRCPAHTRFGDGGA